MKRVICCGSRSWNDRQAIQDALADATDVLGTCEITVVHGAAKGADRMFEQEAQKHGFLIEAHPANWDLGKAAGLLRNKMMADLGADLCIAAWDGRSAGTQHMMDMARGRGIPIMLVEKSADAS